MSEALALEHEALTHGMLRLPLLPPLLPHWVVPHVADLADGKLESPIFEVGAYCWWVAPGVPAIELAPWDPKPLVLCPPCNYGTLRVLQCQNPNIAHYE